RHSIKSVPRTALAGRPKPLSCIAVDLNLTASKPEPHDRGRATSILPSLNVKTARSWRGIVPFTHLAREGRMTVTVGRRELLAALGGGAAAWPVSARAQQPAKVARIGFLGPAPASAYRPRVEALWAGLRDLGYVEGKNITIEYRWAESVDQARVRSRTGPHERARPAGYQDDPHRVRCPR